jgi:hypothetical protein
MIFDEFVNFKDDDADVVTLTISPPPPGSDIGSHATLTWNKSSNVPNKMSGEIDRASTTRLFIWQGSSATGSNHTHSNGLPFDDGAFDWVFCEAVIEHIGGFDKQYLLLKELMRVARKGLFVTTSNRWHPVEFYTALPLLHWLPTSWWRRTLKFLGKEVWAGESMLNLLDARVLETMVGMLPERPSCTIGHVRILGIKAYFFLQIKKQSP